MAQQSPNGTSTQTQLIKRLETVMPIYARVIRQALTEIDGADRLTLPQLRAVQAIAASGESGTLNLTLARHLGVAAPSMTAMIDGLVERGLVDRSIDPSNRRQVIIVLTPLGRQRLDEINRTIEARLGSGLEPLSHQQQQSMLGALEQLDRVLNELGDGTARSGSSD